MLRKLIPGLLVLLFTYSGFTKVFALETFKGTLYNQPFPHWLATPLIVLIPVAELLTAAGLLFDRTRRPALYSALILLTIFTVYIGAILLHLFHKTPCSCGGIFRHLNWSQHFWIDLLLMGMAITALLHKKKQSIPSPVNSFL
ncbi:MAG TPA: MauE/DoxX family redox-associated membrane protein [Puia sp.]|jgi:uncharacterized membrane protein